MKCPKCSNEFSDVKKYCPKCGYLFTFDDKWKQLQHENLEKEVLIKCGIIAVALMIIFSCLK